MFYSFFNLGAMWGLVVIATLRPLYLPQMTRYQMYRRLGGPHSRSGRLRKISPPPPPPPPPRVIRTCFFVLIALHFVFTYNTNIHAPGGIRNRNPSKRSATDPRLRSLGHWDRLGIRSPDSPACSEPYTDYAIPAHGRTTLYICSFPT